MKAADPTYPAFPIACALAAVMIFLVLVTSFVRRSWNLGVSFLCIWLFLTNIIFVVDAIKWSDNAIIKLNVWCDIVSRLKIATATGTSIAPMLITRRLYLIARLRSVNLPSNRAKLWDRTVEWTLGLVWPLVNAGPLYFVLEDTRFEIMENFGCTNASAISILFIVQTAVSEVLPALISVTVYYPEVAIAFYRQSVDVNRFLRSNDSVSRTVYMRILLISSLDILLTLPIMAVDLILLICSAESVTPLGSFPFYPSWAAVHSHWQPVAVPYATITSEGLYAIVNLYLVFWVIPAVSLVLFALFGLTAEARVAHWRIICTIGGWLGWKPASGGQGVGQELGMIEFGERTVEDVSLGSRMRTPSFVNVDRGRVEHDAEHAAASAPDEPNANTVGFPTM